MKVKAYTCISDLGDGSHAVRYFKTLSEAYDQAEQDLVYGPEGEVEELDFTIIDGILCPSTGFDTIDEDFDE